MLRFDHYNAHEGDEDDGDAEVDNDDYGKDARDFGGDRWTEYDRQMCEDAVVVVVAVVAVAS